MQLLKMNQKANLCRFAIMPGGWTVEEKYDVLIRVLKATGTFGKIPWGNFEPPEGRTLKACKHVMDSIKRELGLINSTGSGHPKEGADKSPVKGKKRKAGDTAEEGVEAAEVPRKKRGRPPKKDKEAKGMSMEVCQEFADTGHSQRGGLRRQY